jgi:TP901 family phage tail tape measure protein
MAFGATNQGFGVSFTLHDAFTQTAGKIKNSFNGLNDGVGKLSTKINEALPALGGLGSILLSGGILMGISGIVAKSAEMSDMLAGVTKATGLAGEALMDYRNELDAINTRTSIGDLIDISVIGGKMGVAKEEILGFTKSIDMAVVALGDEFSGGAEEVATRLSIMNNLFAETKSLKIDDALTRIGSSLNFLSDAGVGSAGNISEFTNRIGQLGNMAPSITQVMGLGSALEELGINAQIGAGGVTAILLDASKKLPQFAKQMGLTINEAKRLINTDVNEFFLTLGESFKGMSNVDMQRTLQGMGVGSQEAVKVMAQLSTNIDLVRQRQSQANDAFKEGTSLMKEFENQNATFGASIAIAQKKWDSIMVRIGESLKPILQPILIALTKILEVFADFVSTPIGKTITVITVAFLALVSVMVLIGTIIPPLTTAMNLFGISTTFALGPIGFAIITFGLLVLAVYQASKWILKGSSTMIILGNAILYLIGPVGWLIAGFMNLKRAFSEFDELANGGEVKDGLLGYFQKVGGALTGMMEIWNSSTSEGFSLSEKTRNALERMGILDFVLNIGTYIVRIKEFFRGVRDELMTSFVDPISKEFSDFGDRLANGGEVKDGLLGYFQKVGGALTGMMEIWNSSTSEGFSLSEKTRNALERMGILGFVLNIGTYIVRIKKFFRGVRDELMTSFVDPISKEFSDFGDRLADFFSPLTEAFLSIKNTVKGAFEPLFNLFDSISLKIGKAESSMLSFKNAGKFSSSKDNKEESQGVLKATTKNVNELSRKASDESYEKFQASRRANSTNVNVIAPEQKQPIIHTKLVVDGQVLAKTVNDANEFNGVISR